MDKRMLYRYKAITIKNSFDHFIIQRVKSSFFCKFVAQIIQ